MNSITIEEVKELPKDSYQLIDIRDAESIAHGAIPGASQHLRKTYYLVKK